LLSIIVALIAAQAHSRKEDRAVVISARNFLRSMGGAAGLAIANSIFSNTLKSNIPSSVPAEVVEAIHKTIFTTPDLSGLSKANRDGVLDAYMKAAKGVFILWACCIGMCLLLMIFVKDKGLKRNEEGEKTSGKEDGTDTDSSGPNSLIIQKKDTRSEKIPEKTPVHERDLEAGPMNTTTS